MAQVVRDYGTPGGPVAEQHVHVSWRAIFAGIAVALAVDVLLTLLGFAVGLTAFEPTAGTAKGVGMGVGIWLIITAIASVFAGAYFGSRVAGDPWKGDGVAHGVMVWAGFTIISLWLVGSGLGKVLNSAAGLAGKSASVLMQPDVRSQVGGAMMEHGYNPADAARGGRAVPPQAQQQAEDTAKKAADTAATGGAIASWIGFGISLLSLIGGAFGGMLGAIGEQKQVVRYARREPSGTTIESVR